MIRWWRKWRANRALSSRAERERVARELRRFTCPHDDYLCDKYGCPDDPDWKGDRK